VLATVEAVGGFALAATDGDPSGAVRADLSRHPVTVEVVARPLRTTSEFDGKLVAAPAPQLAVAAQAESAIVTSLAVRPRSLITEGLQVASLEGRPVVALEGVLPAYRDLSVGDSGPDVAQLMAAMLRLGLPCSCGAKLTAADRETVRIGLLGVEKGVLARRIVLPANGVVWVRRLPMRVASIRWRVGQPAKNPLGKGRMVAQRVRVSSPLGTGAVRRGMRSVVRQAGGRELRGRVTRVDRDAGTFEVSIAARTVPKASLPVVVSVHTLRKQGRIPAVPAGAVRLEGGRDASVALLNQDGSIATTRVVLGPDLGGWVGIRRGLRVGQRVVIASWDDNGR
jgi:hypothetical protein